MNRERLGTVLLSVGACLGLLLATTGIVKSDPEVPEDAVAVVNGHAIPKSEYRRALDALRAERPNASEAELRAHVLDRLIDEQLLIDSALELGLADRDPKVRADLGSAAIGVIVDGAEVEPSDAELRAFFQANRDYFRGAPRMHVRRAGLPDTPLSPDKLEQYLGARVTREVLALEPGATLETPQGRVELVEKIPGREPRFDEKLVRAEYSRRAGEQRLRAFFAERRARARIVTP